MINLGEKGIVNVFNEGLTLFRGNLAVFVPDIYEAETAANQQEILAWWANTNNQVVAQVGYTKGPVQGLQYAVTIGSESQIASRRFIGNFMAETSTNMTYSSTFESNYIIGVLGPNQNWLLWSQMLAKWVLLYYTQTLETSYGLFNQRISLGPLQPYPDSMGDSVFPFMRTLTLTAQHEDSWTSLPVQAIKTASMTTSNSTS